jgi:hypothetical protein
MANGNDIQIQPRADAAAPAAPVQSPTPEAQVPAGGGQSALPDEVIQQPVMQALMSGSPPAVSANIEAAQQTEFGQMVSQFGQQMQGAGLGFYRSQGGDLGVVFNQLFLPPEEIVKADEEGRLMEIAPPLEQVEQAHRRSNRPGVLRRRLGLDVLHPLELPRRENRISLPVARRAGHVLALVGC